MSRSTGCRLFLSSIVLATASCWIAGCGSSEDPRGSRGAATPTGGAGSGGANVGGSDTSSGGDVAEGSGGTSQDETLRPSFLKASNADAGDLFGIALAISDDGTTVAVGANREGSGSMEIPSDNSLPDAGAVYVFQASGDTFQQEAYLKASPSGEGDGFGSTLALSADGSTLVVAAPFESSMARGIDGDAGDDTAPGAGAVYVFSHQGDFWQRQAYLKASNTDPGDLFGSAVALSADGNTLAVGAEGESSWAVGVAGYQASNSFSEAGAVYVFQRSAGSWQQQAYLKASNTESGDHFGSSVALSADGSVLAVGAELEDSAATGVDGDQADNSSPFAGAVYLFSRTGSDWTQDAYLKPREHSAYGAESFGGAVALSGEGTTLAVGASAEASSATGVDGDANDFSMPFSGAVYVFDRAGDSWEQQAYVKASNSRAGDEFGHHLDLSSDGSTLIVGAALEAGSGRGWNAEPDAAAPEAGAAYVFTFEGAWTQLGYVKATNSASGDRFGWSVGLSADGRVQAVGASRESSASTAVDSGESDDAAPRAGAVYVYPSPAL